ncbi:hypothetical protein SSAG_03924 [Streptomyces sp. Mg1]|nr:hypothetical protein SSAG_03924 [Streptomyces sp. Mg1]
MPHVPPWASSATKAFADRLTISPCSCQWGMPKGARTSDRAGPCPAYDGRRR